MMKSQIFTLAVAAVALTGCVKGTPVYERGSVTGPLPYAAVRAAPKDGLSSIMLTAGIAGTFAISDECVLYRNRVGAIVLPHFFDGTTVGRDNGGPYVRDGKTAQKFHDGDRFVGGGGSYDFDILELRGNTRAPVPEICAAQIGSNRITSVNPGFRKP